MELKRYKTIGLVCSLLLALAACKKDPDKWLKDNVQIVGKLPVIANFTLVPPQTAKVTAGTAVKLDLRFWSEEDMDKVNLNATVGAAAKQQVFTSAYQKAYSTISRTDSLIMTYAVPAGTVTGTQITVEAEVVGKNTLSKKSAPIVLTVQ